LTRDNQFRICQVFVHKRQTSFKASQFSLRVKKKLDLILLTFFLRKANIFCRQKNLFEK
jgi:hypothetical protein